MNEHDKFAEQLIERGLARAADVEPLAGLEERLLGRLEARPEPRMRWWWMAAPVAAVLLIVALIYWRPAPSKPAPRIAEAPRQAPQVAPVPAPPAPTVAHAPREPRKVARAPRLTAPVLAPAPRQEVFPSPAPLTEEERTLVAFARRRPQEAEKVAEQQKKPVERVMIAAIKIEPLVTEEETSGIE